MIFSSKVEWSLKKRERGVKIWEFSNSKIEHLPLDDEFEQTRCGLIFALRIVEFDQPAVNLNSFSNFSSRNQDVSKCSPKIWGKTLQKLTKPPNLVNAPRFRRFGGQAIRFELLDDHFGGILFLIQLLHQFLLVPFASLKVSGACFCKNATTRFSLFKQIEIFSSNI